MEIRVNLLTEFIPVKIPFLSFKVLNIGFKVIRFQTRGCIWRFFNINHHVKSMYGNTTVKQ